MSPEELREQVRAKFKPGDIVQLSVKGKDESYIKDAVVCGIFPHHVQLKYMTEHGKQWLSTCLLNCDIVRRSVRNEDHGDI